MLENVLNGRLNDEHYKTSPTCLMLGRSGLSWVQGRGDGAFLRVLSGGHNGDTEGGLAVMEDTEVERRMGDSSNNGTDFLVLQSAAK